MEVYTMENKYLAITICYIGGFKFYKNGYGKDTVYTFEDTDNFRRCMNNIANLKKDYRG